MSYSQSLPKISKMKSSTIPQLDTRNGEEATKIITCLNGGEPRKNRVVLEIPKYCTDAQLYVWAKKDGIYRWRISFDYMYTI